MQPRIAHPNHPHKRQESHYCLGAKLAKMEIRALLSELLPRLRSIELAGDPALMQTTFVGGLKHLPIRYELT